MHTHTIKEKKKKKECNSSVQRCWFLEPIDRLRKGKKGEWGKPVGCGVRPNFNVDLGMEANNIGFGSAGDAAAVAFRVLW